MYINLSIRKVLLLPLYQTQTTPRKARNSHPTTQQGNGKDGISQPDEIYRPCPVILRCAQNLYKRREILRCAQNDKGLLTLISNIL